MMDARTRRYRNSEKGRATARRARLRYSTSAKGSWRMLKYGVTPEQWTEMSTNGCGICGTTTDLVVDHDHKTGRVRGALCRQHNAAIGLMNDDPDLVRRALQWLERST